MADDNKFMVMQPAHFRVVDKKPQRKRACFTYCGIPFQSHEPMDRINANAINQAVEEITGVEIPTILPDR
jgi:hypothetical protein